MVNRKQHIRNTILELLYKASGETVSGVHLSETLGISRVAVWKHINALKQSGFDIVSQPKGYSLLNHRDLLMPFCFKEPLQHRIFYFNELESTMDKARELAKNGAPHLSVIIADNQTASRGRLNRKWFSSRGGLWMTPVLKPDTPPVMAYIFNFAASLSLSKSLRELHGLDVFVKWPNDLLLNGKKLVGILSEMETRGDMVEFVNIGIGINVNNTPQRYEPKAISLRDVLGEPVSRKAILEHFLETFETCLRTMDNRSVINEWKKVTATIGSRVRVETLGDVFEGRALDVDESGALIIETNDGETRKIIYGDCFHA